MTSCPQQEPSMGLASGGQALVSFTRYRLHNPANCRNFSGGMALPIRPASSEALDVESEATEQASLPVCEAILAQAQCTAGRPCI